jgi:hypothetical protein
MLLLLACAAPTEGESGESGPADTAFDSAAPESVTPVWGLTEVEAVIAGDLADERPSPQPVLRGYAMLLQHASPGCPSFEDPNRGNWQGWATIIGETCYSEDGWGWFGLTQASGVCDLDPEGTSVLGLGVVASFEVTSPEGVSYVGGGTFLSECLWTSSGGSCDEQITGTFHFPGAEVAWLSEGIEAAVYSRSTWEGDDWAVTLTGGAELGAGDIALDAVVLTPSGVSGGLSVRDPTGYWHELELGPDGCGTLTFAGVEEGTVCPDFSAWLVPPAPLEEFCSGS